MEFRNEYYSIAKLNEFKSECQTEARTMRLNFLILLNTNSDFLSLYVVECTFASGASINFSESEHMSGV